MTAIGIDKISIRYTFLSYLKNIFEVVIAITSPVPLQQHAYFPFYNSFRCAIAVTNNKRRSFSALYCGLRRVPICRESRVIRGSDGIFFARMIWINTTTLAARTSTSPRDVIRAPRAPRRMRKPRAKPADGTFRAGRLAKRGSQDANEFTDWSPPWSSYSARRHASLTQIHSSWDFAY